MRAIFQGKFQFFQNSHTSLIPQGSWSVSQQICHRSYTTLVLKFRQELAKCSAVAELQSGICYVTSIVPVQKVCRLYGLVPQKLHPFMKSGCSISIHFLQEVLWRYLLDLAGQTLSYLVSQIRIMSVTLFILLLTFIMVIMAIKCKCKAVTFGKRPQKRPRHIWEDNINMTHKQCGRVQTGFMWPITGRLVS